MIAWPAVVKWSANVDYVRLTSKGENLGTVEGLYSAVVHSAVVPDTGATPEFKPWGWMGYRGEQSAHGAYGTGAQGSILQASSWAAQNVCSMAPPYAGVPRCDVAVTVWFDRDAEWVAEAVAHDAHSYAGTQGAVGASVRLVKGFGKGDTAYIGSRVSDRFVRVYDKWRESGEDEEYRHAWRFEVEYKNGPAAKAWATATGPASDAPGLAAMVGGELRGRGIVLPRLEGLCAVYRIPAKAAQDSVDRKLAWLQNQVRPSIDKMLAQGVSLNHILDVLGLTVAGPKELARSCATSAKGDELE